MFTVHSILGLVSICVKNEEIVMFAADFGLDFISYIILCLLTTREAVCFIILVDSVCLYVCLPDDNLRKLCHKKFVFAHSVHLQGVRVQFVYEGHWVMVKVKVTGAKKVNNHPVFSQQKPA